MGRGNGSSTAPVEPTGTVLGSKVTWDKVSEVTWDNTIVLPEVMRGSTKTPSEAIQKPTVCYLWMASYTCMPQLVTTMLKWFACIYEAMLSAEVVSWQQHRKTLVALTSDLFCVDMFYIDQVRGPFITLASGYLTTFHYTWRYKAVRAMCSISAPSKISKMCNENKLTSFENYLHNSFSIVLADIII